MLQRLETPKLQPDEGTSTQTRTGHTRDQRKRNSAEKEEKLPQSKKITRSKKQRILPISHDLSQNEQDLFEEFNW